MRYQTSLGPVQEKKKIASPLEKYQQFSVEQSTSFQQDFVTASRKEEKVCKKVAL